MLRFVLVLAMLSGCDFIFRVDEYDGARDATADATDPGLLLVVGSAENHDDNQASALSISLTVPPSPDRFLIVSVEISIDGGGNGPAVDMLTWNGTALTRLDQVVGVPDSPNTRSEQWQLVAPSAGIGTVAIHLTTNADTIRASAMVFAGVDQTTPVRAFVHSAGNDSMGTVTLASATGDLVESTVGQGGTGIQMVKMGQFVYDDLGNGSHTLDNAAGGTLAGAAPTVTVTWIFNNTDDWQAIAASIEPAAH